MIIVTIPDYSKVGRKGVPLYFEAHNFDPPKRQVSATPGETLELSGEVFPRSISRRQFFQYLSVIGIISEEEALEAAKNRAIPKPLDDIINGLHESARFGARMLVTSANDFDIDNGLSDVVRKALGWSEAQKIDFWKKASKI